MHPRDFEARPDFVAGSPVGAGELACGEQGEGRMLEPAEIMQTVERLLLADGQGSGKHILITAGGTREYIDSVRYIGNLSSGRTASSLADELTVAGHHVTWLGAEDAEMPDLPGAMERFCSFDDLAEKLQALLTANEYDVVIHAAAVSDFSVASVLTKDGEPVAGSKGKLSSEADLLLRLRRNPKLLNRISGWSKNADVSVIGFKLTDTSDLQQRSVAVNKQFEDSKVDAIVHNDLSEITPHKHPFYLHIAKQEPEYCADVKALAKAINKLMEAVS